MLRGFGPTLIALTLLTHGCSDSSPQPEPPRTPETAPVAETRTTNLAVLGQDARQAKAEEDWESAHQIYLEALAVAPGHPILYERIAEVEVRLGKLDAAVAHLATMARLGGTTPQIDLPLFAPLADHPDFAEVADQIRANGAPQKLAEVFVTASLPIDAEADLEDFPPPAIVRIPL